MSRSLRRHHNARVLAKYREAAKGMSSHGMDPQRRQKFIERTARQLRSYHHSCSWCRHPDGAYNRRHTVQETRRELSES